MKNLITDILAGAFGFVFIVGVCWMLLVIADFYMR